MQYVSDFARRIGKRIAPYVVVAALSLACGAEAYEHGIVISTVTRVPASTPTPDTYRCGHPEAMIFFVNAHRSENGIRGLREDALMSKAAQRKAEDMALNQYFDHSSKVGINAYNLMQDLGVQYSTTTEIIAKNNYSNALETAFRGLKKSPSHNAAILNSDFNRTGVGIASDGNRFCYYVQLFAD